METHGANCLSAARSAGHSVTLPAITSCATSLGALTVADKLLEICLNQVICSKTKLQSMESQYLYLIYMQPDRVISAEVSDAEAKSACVRFADDHRMMVEPACGSVLSSLYSGHLARMLPDLAPGPVVMVVCGGNIVNTDLLASWRNEICKK